MPHYVEGSEGLPLCYLGFTSLKPSMFLQCLCNRNVAATSTNKRQFSRKIYYHQGPAHTAECKLNEPLGTKGIVMQMEPFLGDVITHENFRLGNAKKVSLIERPVQVKIVHVKPICNRPCANVKTASCVLGAAR